MSKFNIIFQLNWRMLVSSEQIYLSLYILNKRGKAQYIFILHWLIYNISPLPLRNSIIAKIHFDEHWILKYYTITPQNPEGGGWIGPRITPVPSHTHTDTKIQGCLNLLTAGPHYPLVLHLPKEGQHYGQLIFRKSAKTIQCRKQSLQQMVPDACMHAVIPNSLWPYGL